MIESISQFLPHYFLCTLDSSRYMIGFTSVCKYQILTGHWPPFYQQGEMMKRHSLENIHSYAFSKPFCQAPGSRRTSSKTLSTPKLSPNRAKEWPDKRVQNLTTHSVMLPWTFSLLKSPTFHFTLYLTVSSNTLYPKAFAKISYSWAVHITLETFEMQLL